MRNITAVRGILRSREAAHHPKMQENVTFQGLNCAEFDNTRHTGASTTGEAWCYVPIGPHGAYYHPSLATEAKTTAHQHPLRGGGGALPPLPLFSPFLHMKHPIVISGGPHACKQLPLSPSAAEG